MAETTLLAKIIISAKMNCLTGLHIGATPEEVEIGGNDNPVIRDKTTGIPFVPGSSIKGKLRHLCEWTWGEFQIKSKASDQSGTYEAKPSDDPASHSGQLFGVPAEVTEGVNHPTALTVRDAFLIRDNGVPWEKVAPTYTEVKAENTLDRITSAANPRQVERVPAGAAFDCQFVLDIYNGQKTDEKHLVGNLLALLQMLQDSGLGGGVSRGSGRVRFVDLTIERRPREFYFGGREPDRWKFENLDEARKQFPAQAQ